MAQFVVVEMKFQKTNLRKIKLRIHRNGMINGKLIAMIGGSCNRNPICLTLLREYTGVQWYYYFELLMKRFKPKREKRFGQLIVKFGQLTMMTIETLPEFIDRIRDCIVEIRACDPSQVPTEEQIAIRA